jgi:serine/threonine-protein kinase RsbW/stage II sporulation protein AB (anti-sigma F factor)
MQSVTQGLSVTYEAKPSSVAMARTALAEFAADAGASDTQVDNVRLAASEAVTNAVLHAYRGRPGRIHVTAALAGRELWILVSDEGGGMQPRADRPGLGLGLGLISQVCDDMAIVPRSSGGTEVRILFKLEGAPEHAQQEPQRRQPQRSQSQSASVAGTPAEMSVGLVGPVPSTPAVPAAPLVD